MRKNYDCNQILYSYTENPHFFSKSTLTFKLILAAYLTREMATGLHSQKKHWQEGEGNPELLDNEKVACMFPSSTMIVLYRHLFFLGRTIPIRGLFSSCFEHKTN